MLPSIPNNHATKQTSTFTRRDFLRGLASLIGLMLIRFDRAAAPVEAERTRHAFAWDKSVFDARVNDEFQCDFGRMGIHSLKLLQSQVSKIPEQSSRMLNMLAALNYVLIFRGPRHEAATQGTYRFSHAELGDFSLFIVPGSADTDKQHYVAVINQLNAAQPSFIS